MKLSLLPHPRYSHSDTRQAVCRPPATTPCPSTVQRAPPPRQRVPRSELPDPPETARVLPGARWSGREEAGGGGEEGGVHQKGARGDVYAEEVSSDEAELLRRNAAMKLPSSFSSSSAHLYLFAFCSPPPPVPYMSIPSPLRKLFVYLLISTQTPSPALVLPSAGNRKDREAVERVLVKSAAHGVLMKGLGHYFEAHGAELVQYATKKLGEREGKVVRVAVKVAADTLSVGGVVDLS